MRIHRLYRASVLLALKVDLLKELAWLNEVSLKYLKNYQIWYQFPPFSLPSPTTPEVTLHRLIWQSRHHRQMIMSHIGTLPPSEIPFLSLMFSLDAKNYHVWSYRHWLVRNFSLWDSELPIINALLAQDVYNNSAWNHRWFVLFCRRADPGLHSIKSSPGVFNPEDKHLVEEEIIYVKEKIYVAPQNQSPWSYLRAILRHTSTPLSDLVSFAEGFVTRELLLLIYSNNNNNNNNSDSTENQIKSSHALDFLADAYAEQGENEKAGRVLELLGTKADPIRRNYWEFKRRELGLVGASA